MKELPSSLMFFFLLLALTKSTSSLGRAYFPSTWSNLDQKLAAQEMKPLVTKWITEALTNSLPITRARNEKMPLLPPDLPDPLELWDIESETVSGNLTFTEGSLSGLSTVKDNFDVNLMTMSIRYAVSADELVLEGQYSVDALSRLPETEIYGAGNLLASLKQPALNLDVIFTIDSPAQEISVTDVSLDIEFESVYIELENFTMCDHLVDWQPFSEQLKPFFDEFLDENRHDFEHVLKEVLNYLLGDCDVRLPDLINRNFTCPQTRPSSTTEISSTEPSEASDEENEDLLERLVEMGVQSFVPLLAPGATCEFESSTTPNGDGGSKRAALPGIALAALVTFIFRRCL